MHYTVTALSGDSVRLYTNWVGVITKIPVRFHGVVILTIALIIL